MVNENLNWNWNDISREQYYHFLHYKKGTKVKHNKLCSLMTDYMMDNMSDKQKYDIIREVIYDKLQLLPPDKLIELTIESECESFISESNITPSDFTE